MKKVLFIGLLFFLPIFNLQAATYISEIMYDPEGTDTKREWIEIYSDDYYDISSLKLRENDVNHSMKVYQEGDGNYFVVADNPEEFLRDNPNFPGVLYDSAFSLNNSGELLSILINDEVLDEVHYSSSLGAKGTGNSLQKNDDTFIASFPTPGKENSKNSIDESKKDDFESEDIQDISSHDSYVEISDTSPKVLEIGIGRDRMVSINTPIDFEVYSRGSIKGDFVWSLGDGRSIKGKKVSFKYDNPGNYQIVLNSKVGSFYSVSRASVLVFEPNIEIEVLDGMISIKNNSEYEVNIGEFKIVDGDSRFTFPIDTIISKESEIMVDYDVLGFNPKYPNFVYPDGKTVVSVQELYNIQDKINVLNELIKDIYK